MMQAAPRPVPAPAATLRAAQTWVLDLDNTLYPASCGLFPQIAERMTDYVARALGVDRGAAAEVRVRYFREYGTTLRGLMRNHHIDPRHFLDFVHDINYAPVLANPGLDDSLRQLPGRKIVFTNGTAAHARAALDRLGVTARIDGIFDIVDANYDPKPNPFPYTALVRRFGFDPARAVMADDLPANLTVAARMGMTTLWVRSPDGSGEPVPEAPVADAHHVTEDLASWLAEVVKTAP